ncbi:MAG TPA: histidine kinase [Chitinophagaceae bacterium]
MHTRLLTILLILSVSGAAQTPTIDSLKRSLPHLAHPAKTATLRALAQEFLLHYIHSDSALKYARLAYGEATANRDAAGAAEALVVEAEVAGKLLGRLEEMVAGSKRAAALLSGGHPSKRAYAYRTLAIGYSQQGKHSEAEGAVQEALRLAQAANDSAGIGWGYQVAGFNHTKRGSYWKAFQYLVEGHRIGKAIKDSFLTSLCLAFIGRAFNHAGEPAKALPYYFESLRYAHTPFMLLWPHVEDMGYAHLQLKQYDSALYYQQRHRHNLASLTADTAVQKKFSAYLMPSFGPQVQLARAQYSAVLERLLPHLSTQRAGRDVLGLMHSLLLVGQAYAGRKEYTRGLPYARELMQTGTAAGNLYFQKEGYGLLASLFEGRGDTDSAFSYYRQYISLKDSMNAGQFALRTELHTAAAEAEQRMAVLNKDREIQQQQLALKKRALEKQVQRQQLLIGGFVVVLLIAGLVVYTTGLKRKNEQLESEQRQAALQKKALELEMQALRAQMNPHFIFNCLSAIDNLVQTGQADKATTYLARFAKLIRAVLESSRSNLVPFQKDFEAMQLYLELEQFRCNYKFSYTFQVDHRLLQGDYKVPPLIIQPFIENAIHHGLLNKPDADRQLLVSSSLEDDHIVYAITDNGIGRQRAAVIRALNKPEHQSYGIGITRERIGLHNKALLANAIRITDLQHEGSAVGTEVIVRIITEN